MGLTSKGHTGPGRVARARLVTLGLGLTFLLAAGPASAADSMPAPPPLPDTRFGFESFNAGVFKTADGSNANRDSLFTQAGGHPDFATTEFGFNNEPYVSRSGSQANPIFTSYDGETYGYAKDIRVDVPAGLVADPTAFPTCTDEQLDNLSIIGAQDVDPWHVIRKGPPGSGCPVDSQIGTQRMIVRGTIMFGRNTVEAVVPVYNMARSKDQVARFAINPRQVTLSDMMDGNLDRVDMVAGTRPSDNGLFIEIKNLPTNPLMVKSKLSLWGVPGDPIHDPERGLSGMILLTLGVEGLQTDYDSEGGLEATNKTAAFLNNPTSCNGPQTTSIRVTSTLGKVATSSDTTPVGADGCEDVPFEPTTTFGPSALQGDAPAPLSVALNVPQSEDGDELATAHVKDVKLTLPPGMSISPSAATGLDSCTSDQLGQGTDAPVACPAASKVGKVTVTSPLLDEPLEGSVYVGQPLPGQRYRLFLTAEGRGISIRLKGNVDADPNTGQLTTTFKDNPELPFSQLKLDFDGGAKSVIASSPVCGTSNGETTFTPFSGTAPVTVNSALSTVDCGDVGFTPGFGVAPATLQAGAFSPLSVAFSRQDRSQYLSGISATLPLGMTAKLRNVQRCNEDDIAAERCPGGSQIGTVAVKAGPGAAPYALSGSVYLTNGYKGAPFGMVTIVRAIAGPYDLGNVVVRQALKIDPETAQVTVDSDPLPQIKEGIPLRLRDLSMDMTRSGFIRNPTSCEGSSFGTTLTSALGAVASPSSKLTFSGCKNLKFGPKIKLSLANKTQMGKFKHPRLTAVVHQNNNEAGLKSTSVTLPKALALAADNAQGLCETAAALTDKCPKASIVGSAVAETPILDKALKGPVYFVKGERKDPKTGRVIKTLPTLYVALRGETPINLRATTSVVRNQLVTTFPSIPDQPISKFTLNINGGKHGIIATTVPLCGTKLTGKVSFGGQNGAATKASNKISTVCIPGKKAKKTAKKASHKASSKK